MPANLLKRTEARVPTIRAISDPGTFLVTFPQLKQIDAASCQDYAQLAQLVLVLPDCDVSASYTDLDAQDSGRDASGVMHRIPLRYKVGSWDFHYTLLTEEDVPVSIL